MDKMDDDEASHFTMPDHNCRRGIGGHIWYNVHDVVSGSEDLEEPPSLIVLQNGLG